MKAYRTLTISGTYEILVATIAEIENRLNNGWQRNKQIEEDGRNPAGLAPEQLRYCFKCEPTPSRKGALVVLMSDPNDNLQLTNIVPDELGQLTFDEFNSILEEFVQKFVRPAIAKTGAELETSSGIVTIDDWFTRETAEKLRRFLKLTHGSTSHPEDEKLWNSFLVSADRENADVHGDLLRRWLKEDAGIHEHYADQLASDYQRLKEFLMYKEQFQGA